MQTSKLKIPIEIENFDYNKPYISDVILRQYIPKYNSHRYLFVGCEKKMF